MYLTQTNLIMGSVTVSTSMVLHALSTFPNSIAVTSIHHPSVLSCSACMTHSSGPITAHARHAYVCMHGVCAVHACVKDAYINIATSSSFH